MKEKYFTLQGRRLPVHSCNTLVIGSGAAALNAALQLHYRGITDIIIVTESWGAGTSNNAGSDKQTYYKLSTHAAKRDSAIDMATDLWNGGCMHGDIALCEAQHSLEAFYHLVRMGVPFPFSRYGSYPGYITDHETRGRATSTGPSTSQQMFSHLAQEVIQRNIRLFTTHQVFTILIRDNGTEKYAAGALAFNHHSRNFPGIVLFNAVNIVVGTGGPAELYKYSVYPSNQVSAHGMIFRTGAIAQNLTESQFGIGTVKYRWNLSGSYQQAIPRYYSTNGQGKDEKEFLTGFFPDIPTLCRAIFLKEYQWPFDPRKIANHGSSLIDLLVYRETTVRGRKVFIDYSKNPGGSESFRLESLHPEVYRYLKNSGALQPTPVERLIAMNRPAFDKFRQQGIDLSRKPLDAAVCVQHNNGGFQGNIWWESNIKHLFPVGEVNGSHGVYRPGGAALNAGQVGGIRAALFIAKHYDQKPPPEKEFLIHTGEQLNEEMHLLQQIMERKNGITVAEIMSQIKHRMSECASIIRRKDEVTRKLEEARNLYSEARQSVCVHKPRDLRDAIRAVDACLTHVMYLEAINEYLEKGGRSRGSFLVPDPKGLNPNDRLEPSWRISLAEKEDFVSGSILEISFEQGEIRKNWVKTRSIPAQDLWFETVWRDFRESKIIL